ncbi:TRAP-type mannitol/chloroaromatic compound transport system, substrate-binding protein [Lutimaribacter pacificus]|uniref:TRAP-type mannitol/chloroaromatic compound transport system, substrate-binding protein n=1 Tax=Lutimaribacter pacificus TaxID=391948 RepID=A0A1H0L9R4_9RHOB|nr:TRAP transporter substrate-binding protein [Lutimaribacter pacificus]SDO64984.1 TRAP-type mannitol/chloroaromatic compound transport system, substrate-binding protein [Lutimaribacter pacificus]SHK69641.1 TRAP-type mannitol/chloroaromatic compound transport system, substrate-binding protein [Lutimaribacter pacificus]
MFIRKMTFAAIMGAAATQVAAEDWNVQSAFPLSLPQIGTLGHWISDRIDVVSGGELTLTFQEPGAIVPPLEAFDAVQTGAVEAGYSTPSYWVGKIPASEMFTGVPFGPDAGEYLAWFYFGGGKDLYEEIYHKRGVHGVICAVMPPETSGWFREEIATVDDLRGMKMRYNGLGGKVMEKLGVQTQLIATSDLFTALELGTIDGTELSMPAIDEAVGLYQIAKHAYFPAWHQQSTFFEVMFNKAAWDGLSEQKRAIVDTVCEAAVTRSLAEGEAMQFPSLARLEEKGVTLHKWPEEFIDAFEVAWQEVAEEQAAGDEEFAKVWKSYSDFRASYAIWGEMGYLPKN